MLFTTNKKGIPVFTVNNQPVPYGEGLRHIKRLNGLTSEHLADILGVSKRTVEGWIDGRRPGIKRLLELKSITDKYGIIK